MPCFLRYSTDYDEYERHATKADACAAFSETAEELDRYGQRIEASLHMAPSEDEIAEYPDFVLSLGPRGGLVVQST